MSHCEARLPVEVKHFLSHVLVGCNQRRRTLPVRITWKGGRTSGVLLHCDARVPLASRGQKNFMTLCGTESLGHSVLVQDVSGAGRYGTKLCGTGRQWGNIPGAERRGAISLGQNVVGQEVGGAGRHWGNIPGAGRQSGRRFWGRK